MAETAAVRLAALSRVYKTKRGEDVTALDGVSLEVAKGETVGLLGPNGAGKSTLVKVMSTMLVPTSGTAVVLDHDVVSEPHAIRAKVGVVLGGERGLYTRVSARRNLAFWCALYRMDRRETRRRCAELLDRLGLAERADEPVEQFSRGMKQRLHLARGLVHDPTLLFLDEPTSGMDPVAAHGFRDVIRELQAEGRTVFITTHDMAEAEALCHRVSLIDRGSLLFTAPTSEVSRTLGVTECVDFTCEGRGLVDALRSTGTVSSVDEHGARGDWRAYPTSAARTAEVLIWLIERGVVSARRSTPSLEEVYLNHLGTRGLAL
ncbi:Vitamin B12 import ATP-binding protein BtuD [Actinosynnema sp. ALI-1.44]